MCKKFESCCFHCVKRLYGKAKRNVDVTATMGDCPVCKNKGLIISKEDVGVWYGE